MTSVLQLLAALVAAGTTTIAAAERTLVNEAVIPASVQKVWDAFTTSEGFKSWAVAQARIDLRVGGEMRTSYNPASTLEDEHTIVNRILSFEPQRMLSIQNVQAPAGFKNAELFRQTWSVIHFESLAPDRTRVRTVGMGYGHGPDWDEVYDKFKAGNQYTLDKLKQYFAPTPAAGEEPAGNDPGRVLQLLHRLTTGEWIHENHRPEAGLFLVRNRLELGPDGRSIVGRGWIGNENGMNPHSASLIWEAPEVAGGGIWFVNVNEVGEIARGEIRLAGRDTLEWDWANTTREGFKHDFRIIMAFEDATHYMLRIFQLQPDAEPGLVVEARFENVDQAPEKFLKPRAAVKP